MSGDSFEQRVRTLRDSWAERREIKALAGLHDFESQYTLLATLHGWASLLAEDIRKVYGPAVEVALGALPGPAEPLPSFPLSVGGAHEVVFALVERRKLAGARWFVTVTVATAGPEGEVIAAGPERRNGQWTRSRLEDVLLSVLGAYEREFGARHDPGSEDLLRRVRLGGVSADAP